MSPVKAPNWMIAAILAGVVVAGAPTVWSSPPDEGADEIDTGSRAPAGIGSTESTAAVVVPETVPGRQNSAIGLNAQLLGTAVVAGGPSIAFLQLPTGTRFVREGDEIVAGIRLVKVWRNRIDVERAGVHLNLDPASNPGPPDDRSAVSGDVDRLWETHGRTGRSMFYTHYRKPQE